MARATKEAAAKTKSAAAGAKVLTIAAPNMQRAEFTIRGNAPLVMAAFNRRLLTMMMETQAAGSTAKGKKKREPKDFDRLFNESRHVSPEGWDGVHAGGFRAAMISACRLVGFQMTKAKLTVFVEADGYDEDGSTPLVRLTKGKAERIDSHVRNQTGVVDIRTRAMYAPGWECKLRLRWDADQFTVNDVANLLARVGMQVGIGEGRPDSRMSAGMGWGTFDVLDLEA